MSNAATLKTPENLSTNLKCFLKYNESRVLFVCFSAFLCHVTRTNHVTVDKMADRLCFTVFLLLSTLYKTEATASRPNFIIMLMDDVRNALHSNINVTNGDLWQIKFRIASSSVSECWQFNDSVWQNKHVTRGDQLNVSAGLWRTEIWK